MIFVKTIVDVILVKTYRCYAHKNIFAYLIFTYYCNLNIIIAIDFLFCHTIIFIFPLY